VRAVCHPRSRVSSPRPITCALARPARPGGGAGVPCRNLR
jgi:hypothetical protein